MRSVALALILVLALPAPANGMLPSHVTIDPSELWTPPCPSDFLPIDRILTTLTGSLRASTQVPGLSVDFPTGLVDLVVHDVVDPNDASFPIVTRRYVPDETRWLFTWDASVSVEDSTAVAYGPDGSRYLFSLPGSGTAGAQLDAEPVRVTGDTGAILVAQTGLWLISLVDGTRLYYADPHSAGEGRGRLRMVADALGRAIHLNRSPGGEIESLADHYGRSYRVSSSADTVVVRSELGQVQYGVDSRGRLVSVESAVYRASFHYGLDDRLSRWTVNGASTSAAYDASGRVTRMGTLGGEYRIEYPADAGYITITDPGENRWFGLIDRQGVLLGWYSPDATVLEYRRESGETTVDRYGRFGRDRFVFDEFGRLVAYVDTAGDSTAWEYGETGRISCRTGPHGAVARYRYDSRGALIEVDDDSQRASFAYDVWGRLEKITDTNAKDTWIRYAGKTPPARVISPAGLVKAWEYDLAGLPAAVLTGGLAYRIVRSPDGHPVGVSWEDDTSVRIDYQDGWISSLTYSGGMGLRLERDQSGAVVKADFGRGAWTIKRDSLGRAVKLVSSASGSWSFDLDPADRVVRIATGTRVMELFWDDLSGTVRAVRDTDGQWWICQRDLTGILRSLARDGMEVGNSDEETTEWDEDGAWHMIIALSLIPGSDPGLWRSIMTGQ